MKYVRLIVMMLLVVALVVPAAFASNAARGAKAGNIQQVKAPERDEIGSIPQAKNASDPAEYSTQERQELSKGEPSVFVPLTMPKGPVQVSGFSGTVLVGASQAFTSLAGVAA